MSNVANVNVVVEVEPNDVYVDKIDPDNATKVGQANSTSDAAPAAAFTKKSVRKILPKSLTSFTGGPESGNLVAIKASASSQVKAVELAFFKI